MRRSSRVVDSATRTKGTQRLVKHRTRFSVHLMD